MINKVNTWSSDLFNHEYDYRPNWTTQSSVTKYIIHNRNKICDVLGFFKIQTKEIRTVFFPALKKGHLSAHERCTVLLHCPISAEIITVDSQSDLRIFL